MNPLTTKQIARLLVIAALLFGSCQALNSPISQAPAGADASTQAAEGVATMLATLSTPAAPTASATAAPASPATITPVKVQSTRASPTPAKPQGGQATLTPPPDTTYFAHQEIPDFRFPADPQRWKLAEASDDPFAFLVHKTRPGCEIKAVPPSGIGAPQKIERWQLGRLYWRSYDYGSMALVSIAAPRNLFLELRNQQDSRCRADQQAVLKNALLVDEVEGRAAYNPLPTATQRPPLPDFACPNTPDTRLRVGDYAHIVTDVLLLRSEPRADISTQRKKYAQGAPILIEILDGPVCTEKFVYWKVSVGLVGEGMPEPVTGWMAEGDMTEYYLAPGE